jgi:hypothetical protein
MKLTSLRGLRIGLSKIPAFTATFFSISTNLARGKIIQKINASLVWEIKGAKGKST